MPAANDDQVTPEPATRRLGRFGEEAAAEVYRAEGYRVLARNWRCPAGELDLVVARGDVVAFCEVKTRAGRGFGGGYEAVGWRKQRKLRQLAELFLASAGLAPHVIRFDVASILAQRGRRPAVDLFEDAF